MNKWSRKQDNSTKKKEEQNQKQQCIHLFSIIYQTLLIVRTDVSLSK